jgi:hypothetical protein
VARHQQALLGDQTMVSKNLAAWESINGACSTNFNSHREYVMQS